LSGKRKDYAHIVGKASDEKIFVAADILSQYVGTYESPQGPNAVVNVTLADGELILDRTPWIPGKDRQALISLSEKTFAGHFGRRFHSNETSRVSVG
jgi:hypothetical protein